MSSYVAPGWFADFLNLNSIKLATVRTNSFSIYKKESKHINQHFENCYAVLHKLRRETGEKCKIAVAYRHWKKESDHMEFQDLVDKAFNVVKQSRQKSMTDFFQKKSVKKPVDKPEETTEPMVLDDNVTEIQVFEEDEEGVGGDPDIKTIKKFGKFISLAASGKALAEISKEKSQ